LYRRLVLSAVASGITLTRFLVHCHPACPEARRDRVRRLFWRTTKDLLLPFPSYAATRGVRACPPFGRRRATQRAKEFLFSDSAPAWPYNACAVSSAQALALRCTSPRRAVDGVQSQPARKKESHSSRLRRASDAAPDIPGTIASMDPVAVWTIAKTAGEISKKLYEFGKSLKDREAKQQVDDLIDKLRELKQAASEAGGPALQTRTCPN
jgi:hypothetical protein